MTTAPPPAAPPPAAPPPSGPPAGWQPQQYQRTNGFAVASLVLDILFCGMVTALLAVIFGNIALEKIAASNGAEKGRGLAIAGIVLGWIGLGILAIGLLIFLGYGISNL